MKGYACLTHDLTTYTKCGHCFDALVSENELLKSKCMALEHSVEELQKILKDEEFENKLNN